MKRWFVAAGALGVIATGYGCDKKSDATATATATSATASAPVAEKPGAKPADATSATAAATPAATSAGRAALAAPPSGALSSVLHHVPASCPGLRLYIDAGKLLKSSALAPVMAKLDQKIAESLKGEGGEKVEKIVVALKEAGIQPAKAIQEVAACFQENMHAPVVAIGGDFGGKDILALILKATEGGKEPLTKKDADGFAYLASADGKGFFGMVAPNVLVIAGSERQLQDMRKDSDQSASWNVTGKVLAQHLVQEAQTIDTSLVEKGDGYEASMVMSGFTGDAAAAFKNGAQFKTAIQQQMAAVAGKLEHSPMKAIAADVRGAKIEVDAAKSEVTILFALSSAHIADALKAFVETSEEALEAHADKAHAAAMKPGAAKCRAGQVRVVGVKPGGVCVPGCAGGEACPAGKTCKSFPSVDDDGTQGNVNAMACLSGKVTGDDKEDCRVKGCPSGYNCNQVSGFCLMSQPAE